MMNDVVLQELKNLKQILVHDEKPLTLSEASEYLGLAKSSLYKMTSKNLIPHYKPNGKKIYFTKSDLSNYLYRYRKADQNELDQIAVDTVILKASL